MIQLTEGLGPGSIMFGTDEENGAYLNGRQAEWSTLRVSLMEYANQHPDRIRALAHEAGDAVWADMQAAAWLLRARRTETTMDSFRASERAHAEALAKAERLMTEIRRY